MFRQSHLDADAFNSTLDHRLTTTLESLSECLTTLAATLLALKKLSGVIKYSVSSLATITTQHDSALNVIDTRLTGHNTTLATINTCLEKQSNILCEITQKNVSQDACVQTIEGDLTLVQGSVQTFDIRVQTIKGELTLVQGLVQTFNTKLLSLHTTTDTATTTLQTNINDLRARVIPNLRCDLQTDIQNSVNATAQAIDDLRHDLQTGIQQSANAKAQVIDNAMARLTDD